MGFGRNSYRRAITVRIEVLMEGEAGARGVTKWVDYHGCTMGFCWVTSSLLKSDLTQDMGAWMEET
jgi:hypothetical protein